MKIKRSFLNTVFLLACSLLYFASCTSTKYVEDSTFSPVYVTNTKRFLLLPPQYIETPIAAQQLLTAYFGDKSFVLLSYLEADSNGIFISLFNDFGTGMGSISFDGKDVQFDSAIFPKNLKAEYILADLQFTYYKPEYIRTALSELNMKLNIEFQDGVEFRKIYNHKKLIEQIEKRDGLIVIKNFLRGYEYSLQEAAE